MIGYFNEIVGSVTPTDVNYWGEIVGNGGNYYVAYSKVHTY